MRSKNVREFCHCVSSITVVLWQKVNLTNNHLIFQNKVGVILCENNWCLIWHIIQHTALASSYWTTKTKGTVFIGPPCIQGDHSPDNVKFTNNSLTLPFLDVLRTHYTGFTHICQTSYFEWCTVAAHRQQCSSCVLCLRGQYWVSVYSYSTQRTLLTSQRSTMWICTLSPTTLSCTYIVVAAIYLLPWIGSKNVSQKSDNGCRPIISSSTFTRRNCSGPDQSMVLLNSAATDRHYG